MSEKEVQILLQQITQAFSDRRINARDMKRLTETEERLLTYGVHTTITEKQRFWLDDIFARTVVHRDPRRRV